MTTGFRKRFTFWLNLDRDDQLEIAEIIEDLKAQRKFVSTVRDGIRLIVDLHKGNTDVLLELFPDIRKLFTPPTTDNGGLDELKNEIKILQDMVVSGKVETAYKMMETQQVPVVVAPRPKKVAVITEPKTNGKSDGSAANNLLTSLANF